MSSKGESCHLLSEKGSITVLVALLIPIMFLMVMLVADIGQLVFEKIRLQNTVDACALAAATVQSVGLNEIADLNNDLAQEHKKLKAILDSKGGRWYSRGEAEKARDFFYNGKDGVLDHIYRYQKTANTTYAVLADKIVQEVKDDNLPGSELKWENEHNFLTTYEEHYKTVSFKYYDKMCSPSPLSLIYCSQKPVVMWSDPDDPRFIGYHDGRQYRLRRRKTIRNSSYDVMEILMKTNITYAHIKLTQRSKNFALGSSLFGRVPKLTASAEAKPVGGNIYGGKPYYRPVMTE